MNYTPLIEAARQAAGEDPAHDFLHVQRVFWNAKFILQHESADDEIVLSAVLLHELFNYPKNHPDSSRSGDVCAEHAERVLQGVCFPEEKLRITLDCIRNHSFSKGVTPETMEARIVQDADRLDAIGAIGIARCFSSCASMGRPFYAEMDPFCENRLPDDKQYGIDHFYRKLLLLADGMHTETARKLANERTQFMRQFLGELEREIIPGAEDSVFV